MKAEKENLKPFEITGTVQAVLVGGTVGNIITTQQSRITLIQGHGIKGDSHAGQRLIDAREKILLGKGLLKGIEIANMRQVSIVSEEEIRAIEKEMKMPVHHSIEPGCLGENIIVRGIPNLTQLPTGTLLFFKRNDIHQTAVIAVWGENTPCVAPGEVIRDQLHDFTDYSVTFPKAAQGKRGLVGFVYCSGTIKPGDSIIACISTQKFYNKPN